MKMKIPNILLLVLWGVTLMFIANCEGPTGETGPAGTQGPQGEQGPQGPMGNANVKQYIFDGHNFSSNIDMDLIFLDMSIDEFEESIWLVYVTIQYADGKEIFHVPGFGDSASSYYRVIYSSFDPPPHLIRVRLVSGPGEIYDSAIAFQIPSSSTMDMASKSKFQSLELSDYHAVLNHFGDSVETIRR